MSLYLKAVKCDNAGERPPVWIMRQAGRYLPQYRQLRERHSLLELFRNPEMIEKVTHLPVDLLGTDAAILFSDILIILDALGIPWDVIAGKGPVIERSAQPAYGSVADKLSFVGEGIKRLKKSLDVPLIGFAGAPFTVASYLIEGGSSRDLKRTKIWMYRDPEGFRSLMALLTDTIVDYLNLQIEAGVDAIQIFDSWAGQLAAGPFQEYCIPYMRDIMDRLVDPNIPVTLFGRGTAFYTLYMAELQPACLSLDWQCDITQMRNIVPENIALQGNIDPYLLFAEWETVEKEMERILKGMEKDPGFILNLGHGILPDTPVDTVKRLIDMAKAYQPCT